MLKGIAIGMFVAIPVGPLGLLAIQKTISKGWKTGFLSGVGAAASDMIYSTIAVLGVGFIHEFLERHRNRINGAVGILFLIIGSNILINSIKNNKNKNEIAPVKEEPKEKLEDEMMPSFISHFLMGLSNPLTCLVFLGVFAKVGIDVKVEEITKNLMFIVSIFLGSSILWFCITNSIKNSNTFCKIEKFSLVDKIIGTIIILCGVASILKGIII
ncbi:LysE family translocator [Clostridium sp. JNZ J1-5]